MIPFAANASATAALKIANAFEWPGLSPKIAPSAWFLGPTQAFVENGMSIGSALFGRPFVKRFALCYRSVVCLSVLSVCDVRALWPNGWMDQDETWRAGRPRPWPHCVRWGPTSPPPKGHSPQCSAHICCGQMAVWIKMPLGMELGLSPGDLC